MYAIIGANGFLGSYVLRAVQRLTGEKIIATARDLGRVRREDGVEWISCDVQSDASVDALLDRLRRGSCVKIVYLAAYHHPDLVEQDPSLAWDINVTSLSKFLNKAGFAKNIFYASTDSVYGESKDFHHFKETDPLDPVNTYGHQKCAAEALMIHQQRNVVRFPFLISPSLIYKPHFYDEIAGNIRAGKSFEMFADSYRSSLSFENAGRLLVMLMEKDRVPSAVNICGDKALSKYDVGLMIADREGVPRSRIVPVSIRKPQENFSTKRAASTLMDNSLLKQILGLCEIDVFNEPK